MYVYSVVDSRVIDHYSNFNYCMLSFEKMIIYMLITKVDEKMNLHGEYNLQDIL